MFSVLNTKKSNDGIFFNKAWENFDLTKVFWNGKSDTDDLSNKVENLNPSVSSVITGKNESKTLTMDISCEFKYKFDGTKYNLNQWWNNDKCRCECKKIHVCEKNMFEILLNVFVKMENI